MMHPSFETALQALVTEALRSRGNGVTAEFSKNTDSAVIDLALKFKETSLEFCGVGTVDLIVSVLQRYTIEQWARDHSNKPRDAPMKFEAYSWTVFGSSPAHSDFWAIRAFGSKGEADGFAAQLTIAFEAHGEKHGEATRRTADKWINPLDPDHIPQKGMTYEVVPVPFTVRP